MAYTVSLRANLGQFRPGFSLLELAIVLVLISFCAALALPPLKKVLEDAVFLNFTSELTGHLILARHSARISGRPMNLDFTPTVDHRYRMRQTTDSGEQHTVSLSTWGGRFKKRLRAQPARYTLPHPTLDRDLNTGLSSTHGQSVIFGRDGSSSATILFSDGEHRATCAVVSGRTGRIKVFLWNHSDGSWVVYY